MRIVVAGLLVLALPTSSAAQVGRGGDGPRPEAEGSAVVRVDQAEYTVPILCFDATDASAGFITEPSRVTRERTGRASQVTLRAGTTEDHPGELTVNLDRYVAWIPAPESGPTMTLQLDMSPVTVMVEGMPKLLTRDQWMAGERPEGLSGAWFQATCDRRDPGAPSFRRIGR